MIWQNIYPALDIYYLKLKSTKEVVCLYFREQDCPDENFVRICKYNICKKITSNNLEVAKKEAEQIVLEVYKKEANKLNKIIDEFL